MATKLFLLRGALDTSDTHLGTNNAKLDGATSGWNNGSLSTTAGTSLSTLTTNTVNGPTSGVECAASTIPVQFISPPVSADVTISGAVTANLWMAESNMSANVSANFVVDVIRAASLTAGANDIVQIVKSARTTELPVTTPTAENFTATPGAGVVVNRGDRIRVRVFGDDVGATNMASGFTFAFGFNNNAGGANGDSFVSFTETFSFESAPAGSTIYLTDVASDVSTASVDREAWTSRGSGVVDDFTTCSAGWVAPIQETDTAGGTAVDWFTKQLTAFTLVGMAQANIRCFEQNVASNVSIRVEIAVVASDGTSPTVWASWCLSPKDNPSAGQTEIEVSESAQTVWVSGDTKSVTDGQRLRIRIYIDDPSAVPMGPSPGYGSTLYNGTSGGASGDTYVIFPQTLTEFVASGPLPHEIVALQAVNRSSVW